MAQDDARVAGSGGFCRLDVVEFFRFLDVGADQSRVSHPAKGDQGDHDVVEPRAKDRHEDHRCYKERHGHEDVCDPHDDFVEGATVEAGDGAEDEPDQGRAEGHD